MYKNIQEFDQLAIFTSFLSVLNYSENLKQSSNDDLMHELKHQNTKYMEKIIEQNELIISLLKGDKIE